MRLRQLLLVLPLLLQTLLLRLQQALLCLIQQLGGAVILLRLLLGKLAGVRLRGLNLSLGLRACFPDGFEQSHAS